MIFTVDDATVSMYRDIFPILEEYGMPAVASVPSDVIGNSGRLAQTQLEELVDAG